MDILFLVSILTSIGLIVLSLWLMEKNKDLEACISVGAAIGVFFTSMLWVILIFIEGKWI